MKGRKNNQKGKNQESESWAEIPEEWIPDLLPDFDIDFSAWDFKLPDWDFKLPESWKDFPDFNDNRKGAESLDNKGKKKNKG